MSSNLTRYTRVEVSIEFGYGYLQLVQSTNKTVLVTTCMAVWAGVDSTLYGHCF